MIVKKFGGTSVADAECMRRVARRIGEAQAAGDSVVVVKTMKIKGAPSPLKAGTKVKNIRLVDGDHDIDCKIPGFGAMKLKSSIVKKA